MRLNNLSCTTLGILFVCMVIAVPPSLSADEGDNRQTTEGASSKGEAEQAFDPPVKWEQIWFMDDGPKKVKITLYDMKSVDEQVPIKDRQGLGIAGENGLVYETRDPIVLTTFYNALTMPLRVAIPDEPGYGAGGGGWAWPALGHIEVFTSNDSFIIGIHRGGFSLDSKHLRQQNKFFSWMIAQQLDDILFSKTGRHIPLKIRKGLSGESYIEGRKHNYEAIRNDELLRSERKEARTEEESGVE